MKVELVTHSGSDLLVVDAARASFSKKSEMVVVSTEVEVDEEGRCYAEYPVFGLSDRDVKLVNYLARERHMLPFRHPQITLRCKAPLFVARQVGKHQTGMSWSEESRRYITDDVDFFIPDMWRKKAENVKQGSSEEPTKLPITGKCAVCGATLVYPEDSRIKAAHVARIRFCSGKCQTRNFRNTKPLDNRFIHWKSAAKQKGMEFSITMDDLAWPDKCMYLDLELDYSSGKDKHDATASLDRIDSSKGYVPGNVQIISNLANRMKNDASSDMLVKFAKNAALIHGGVFVDKSSSYEGFLEQVHDTYKRMIADGVAPEQARMILPQAAMTTWVWTGSLLSFVHMIKERSASGAQKETRDFAAMVAEVIEHLYPVSYKALMEN